MKKHTWDNPNKMHFESPLKSFNERVRVIVQGNAVTDTQWSTRVRAYNTTECNGLNYQPGELQKFDLSVHAGGVPEYVQRCIREKFVDESGWFYHFFYWKSINVCRTLGYVVFNDDHSKYQVFVNAHITSKSREALYECIEYLKK